MDNRYSMNERAERDIKAWENLKKGNIEALEILFLAHYSHLYNYAVKLSGNSFLAKDCIHDLFFRIWNRRDNLGDVKSVKSYLWISMRRDMIRAMKGDPREMLTDNLVDFAPRILFTPEEFIIHDESKRECRKALSDSLNKLTPRQREAVYLRFFNGMSYEEMEQIMSVSYQTARNYVYDGVQALRMHFDKIDSKQLIPYILSVLVCFV